MPVCLPVLSDLLSPSRGLTLADIERLRVPEWLKGRERERRTSEGWEPFTLE